MIFPDLNAILPVEWAVVGAAATRLYMPERATLDFDVLIRAVDAQAARDAMRAAGLTYLRDLRVGETSWEMPGGFPVDVLEGDAPWCAQAIASAQTNRDAQGSPVIPLPYLVLMKFQSSRAQDVGDITRILGQADADALAAVRAVFRQFANDGDDEDLESLILLGQMEMQ